ncbi:MAG: sigma factor-like helix-turn-helix DNA-binding protein, partial [Candidatus Hydrogenedentota bacterium]
CLERVGEAMRSLSPKLREAMVLFYLEGMTASAGAEALGIGVDTMKKRLRLGRKGLQRYFAKHDEGELDQLLPHRSKRRADQIVAGLALGPVMPDFGAAIAHAGPAMWLGDLRHGASPWLLQEKLAVYVGVPFASAKNVIAAGVIALAAGSAATVLAINPSDDAKAPVVVTGAIGDPSFLFTDLTQDEGGDDAPAIDGVNAVPAERVLVVENLGSAAGSGLRVGDKIVKVNGHPISTSVIEDPRGYIYGPAGAKITVTVRREDGAGPATELDMEIPALRAGGPTT